MLRFKIHSKPGKSDELMATASGAPCGRRSVPRSWPPRPRFLCSASDRRALTLLGPVAVALTAAALAGCGGGGGSSSQAQSGAPTTTISVGTKGVGDVLMDSHTNHTLYLFTKDTGPVSTCSGACAHSWPPVRATGTPAVGGGAKASLIGTVKRSDGSAQVTYNGHPLYLFVGDNAPSSTNGQAVTAFGAPWFAVSPAGNAVTKRCAATGCSSGY